MPTVRKGMESLRPRTYTELDLRRGHLSKTFAQQPTRKAETRIEELEGLE